MIPNRKMVYLAIAALLASIWLAVAVGTIARAASPAEESNTHVVPAGSALTVTVDQALSSKTTHAGQAFSATLAQPVIVHGKTLIRKGSHFSGTVITAKEQGKIKGEGELELSLTAVTVSGWSYPIHTHTLVREVKGKGKRTAATTGGGAVGGALLGGLVGGGKGVGIGGLVGGAAGLAGGAMTGNKQVEIPAESELTFTLSKSLSLPARGQ